MKQVEVIAADLTPTSAARCQKSLWGIAWVSFFWSVSSLMIFSILPAFLIDDLKISYSKIGFIEGIAISFSFIAKFFAGIVSDKLQSRKPLIMFGSVLTALIKPLFAFCSGASMLFGIRFIDRIAKGIRSSPTDALVADLSHEAAYASNFGFRQSLYIFGEVVGAVLAVVIMLVSNNNYRLVFGCAFVPALAAVYILYRRVDNLSCQLRLRSRSNGKILNASPFLHDKKEKLFNFQYINKFSSSFWLLMLACFFLMLARFSEGFLTLKAKSIGWPVALLPCMLIVMNLVHACVALPAGKYADRTSRLSTLFVGPICMVAAQLMMAYAVNVVNVAIGVILVGIHMGVTQGLLKALIAQTAAIELRATAFSIFFAISGFAIFIGNSIAGKLADFIGLSATFYAGCGFTVIALCIVGGVSVTKISAKKIAVPA